MIPKEQKRAIDAVERIGLVLGAFYVLQLGNIDKNLKAKRLNQCGFSNVEIAKLLGMTTNAVNVALHRARKAKKKTKKSKKKKR